MITGYEDGEVNCIVDSFLRSICREICDDLLKLANYIQVEKS